MRSARAGYFSRARQRSYNGTRLDQNHPGDLCGGCLDLDVCRRHGIDLPLGNVIGTAFRTHPIEQAIAVPFYTESFACRPQMDGSYTVSVSGRGRLEPGAQGIRYLRQFYPTFKSRRKNLTLNLG